MEPFGHSASAHAPRDTAHGEPTWHLQVHDSLQSVSASTWQSLWLRSPQPTPFMHHAWLSALERHGCATPDTGWQPLVLTAHAALPPQAHTTTPAPPQAACVAWLKSHSHGEFVFDWAWAQAYERHGLAYYPKLVVASPFSPVPGSRLLGEHPGARQALLHGLRQLTLQEGWSSAHVLFLDDEERAWATQAEAHASGWMLRRNVQFHWQQPAARWPDMEAFLGSLQRDKRKKIQQERRKVREAGVTVQALQGHEITEADWDFFFTCYANTYHVRGQRPYLNRAFFREVAHTMPEHWLMFTASRQGRPVASALLVCDLPRRTVWGRHWGCVEEVPCLHFELCYYAPLQWCIEHGIDRFEGGAQGEHKMARGFSPVDTWSAHWLADPRFASAVDDFLAREREGVAAYVDELTDRSPFKG
ncbi:N-acetyltransferase [Aquabacterium lacunae]|uniref:N-acetyltransferase n=1 Tax=Aquabacterium lacunae TaxID=2528630 RepID=A0A4Q9H5A9_9BURK|nr:GNAT family N-acetyltransferase [Aquabacterium lacunae]TBO32974.1 N-acetyltransferase [Aquabacterium lacunae]